MKRNFVEYNGGRVPVRGHGRGESKYHPIAKNYRGAPIPIQHCLNFILSATHVPTCASRSQVVRAITHALRPGSGIDLKPYRDMGVSPVTAYIQQRVVKVRFVVGFRVQKVFVVRIYDNDIKSL